MNANMKKWMTVGAVVAAMIVVLGGNAEAKKDTQIPNGTCDQCAQTLRSGDIVCELTSCQDGCEYACRYEDANYED